MAVLSAREIYALCRKYGFSARAATIGTAIVLGESGGNTQALNVNKDGSRDRGLWQINDHGKKSPPVSDTCAFDSTGRCATRAAKKIYDENGGSFRRWVVYTSGAYLAKMPQAKAAAAGADKAVEKGQGVDVFKGKSGSTEPDSWDNPFTGEGESWLKGLADLTGALGLTPFTGEPAQDLARNVGKYLMRGVIIVGGVILALVGVVATVKGQTPREATQTIRGKMRRAA